MNVGILKMIIGSIGVIILGLFLYVYIKEEFRYKKEGVNIRLADGKKRRKKIEAITMRNYAEEENDMQSERFLTSLQEFETNTEVLDWANDTDLLE